jgi:hypothetical protein
VFSRDFVERVFLALALIAVAIIFIRFAFGSAIISVSLTALRCYAGAAGRYFV